jgi:DNA replication protein DnaC
MSMSIDDNRSPYTVAMEDARQEQGAREERAFPKHARSNTTETVGGDRLATVLNELKARICTDEEIARAEGRTSRWSRSAMLEASGIASALPEEDRLLITTGAARNEDALVHVRDFLVQRDWPGGKSILVLMGDAGTGKTVAAAWALAQIPGVYIEAERVCRAHAGRHKKAEDEFTTLLRAELVVIDEVGTEEDLERARMAYRELVNKRQDRRRPTILMGNCGVEELQPRFDRRTHDRIRTRGLMRGLEGPSLRMPTVPREPKSSLGAEG